MVVYIHPAWPQDACILPFSYSPFYFPCPFARQEKMSTGSFVGDAGGKHDAGKIAYACGRYIAVLCQGGERAFVTAGKTRKVWSCPYDGKDMKELLRNMRSLCAKILVLRNSSADIALR